MLVLSRKPDQQIHVPEYGIKIHVLGVTGKRVRIGIDAPEDVRIIRSELEFEQRPKESTAAIAEDWLEPGYVWPLGVRFDPSRATVQPSQQSRKQISGQYAATRSTDSRSLVASMSH